MRFLDTNVLVYAMDPADGRKQKIAMALLTKGQARRDAAVSFQVLTEFSNVMLGKFHRPADIVAETVAALAGNLVFVEPSVRHLTRALEIHAFCQISIWDSLVVAAAEAGGCDTILTEDLNDGQRYCGILAENPFRQV